MFSPGYVGWRIFAASQPCLSVRIARLPTPIRGHPTALPVFTSEHQSATHRTSLPRRLGILALEDHVPHSSTQPQTFPVSCHGVGDEGYPRAEDGRVMNDNVSVNFARACLDISLGDRGLEPEVSRPKYCSVS